jgi:hypothetical protein
LILPAVESCSKSGAVSLMRSDIFFLPCSEIV